MFNDTPAKYRHKARLLFLTLAILGTNTIEASCLGMEIHAHRGSPSAPENSLSAVKEALSGGWDGVEIDIQQLRDGEWVLHHDPFLGRTTSLQGRRTSDIDSATWNEVQLKQRNGQIVTEKAPYLRDMIALAELHTDKVLNIEIKQTSNDCRPAQRAVTSLHKGISHGQWFLTSVERRQLQCARKFDPEGYLGQIVIDAQALAMASNNKFHRANAARLQAPIIDQAWLQRLQQEIGKPVGAHIDINTLENNPALLKVAREMVIPIFTYHLGTDKEHVQALIASKRRTGLLPSGAIINETPDAFCNMLSKK